MRHSIRFVICMIMLGGMPVLALDLASGRFDLEVESLKGGAMNYIEAYGSSSEEADQVDDWFADDESIYDYDYKSPKRAFVYSLLIPGWGQKYAGSHAIKPLLFLAAEAGLWMGYFKYRNDGNKRTDDYEAFADSHWTAGTIISADSVAPDSTYRWWLLMEYDTPYDGDITELTHELPDSKTQQYYEMIGKYDQFRAGWDDYWLNQKLYDSTNADEEILFLSPNREMYENMRKDANDLLDKANNFVIVSLLNRIISGIDAAMSARRYNRNQAKEMWLTVNAELKKYSATEEIPILRFTCRF